VHADYLGFMPPLRAAASSDPQTWVATWGSSEQIPETQNALPIDDLLSNPSDRGRGYQLKTLSGFATRRL